MVDPSTATREVCVLRLVVRAGLVRSSGRIVCRVAGTFGQRWSRPRAGDGRKHPHTNNIVHPTINDLEKPPSDKKNERAGEKDGAEQQVEAAPGEERVEQP